MTQSPNLQSQRQPEQIKAQIPKGIALEDEELNGTQLTSLYYKSDQIIRDIGVLFEEVEKESTKSVGVCLQALLSRGDARTLMRNIGTRLINACCDAPLEAHGKYYRNAHGFAVRMAGELAVIACSHDLALFGKAPNPPSPRLAWTFKIKSGVLPKNQLTDFCAELRKRGHCSRLAADRMREYLPLERDRAIARFAPSFLYKQLDDPSKFLILWDRAGRITVGDKECVLADERDASMLRILIRAKGKVCTSNKLLGKTEGKSVAYKIIEKWPQVLRNVVHTAEGRKGGSRLTCPAFDQSGV